MPLLVSRTGSRAIQVGFDGIEAAGFSVPSLTAVSPDKREIARTAVSLPLNRIDAPDSGVPHRYLVIGHRIVVRESSGD
jgi:DNA-binding LacI/PurR family transcriptional regulator